MSHSSRERIKVKDFTYKERAMLPIIQKFLEKKLGIRCTNKNVRIPRLFSEKLTEVDVVGLKENELVAVQAKDNCKYNNTHQIFGQAYFDRFTFDYSYTALPMYRWNQYSKNEYIRLFKQVCEKEGIGIILVEGNEDDSRIELRARKGSPIPPSYIMGARSWLIKRLESKSKN